MTAGLGRVVFTGMVLLLSGCANAPGSTPATLVTGKVDSSAVFDADPEYAALSKQYITERVAMSKAYVTADKGKDAAATARLQTEFSERQKELDKKWLGKTNDFVKARRSKLEEAAGAICRDKGIDLVVVDGPRYRTVEWGGVDITQDLMGKLYGAKPVGSPSPSPAAGAVK